MQGLTLVFTDRKSQADYLEDFLINNKFPATAIHGDLTQAEREFVSTFRSYVVSAAWYHTQGLIKKQTIHLHIPLQHRAGLALNRVQTSAASAMHVMCAHLWLQTISQIAWVGSTWCTLYSEEGDATSGGSSCFSSGGAM